MWLALPHKNGVDYFAKYFASKCGLAMVGLGRFSQVYWRFISRKVSQPMPVKNIFHIYFPSFQKIRIFIGSIIASCERV